MEPQLGVKEKVEGAVKPLEQKPDPQQTPPEEKPVYTEKQLRDLINAAKGDAGPVGRERDTLKAELEKSSQSLKEAQAKHDRLTLEMKDLKADLEALGEDNPNAKRLSERLTTLEDAVAKAKQRESDAEERVKTVEAERTEYAETVNYALATTLEESVVDVAMESGINPDTLMELCQLSGVKGNRNVKELREKIMSVANIIAPKKKEEAKPTLTSDSGKTTGEMKPTDRQIIDNFNSHPNDIKAAEEYKTMMRRKGHQI